MTGRTTDLDDDLSELFGGTDAPRREINLPASFQPRDFTEPCAKCRGTGQFRSFSGRLIGQCFACKGKGKNTFKSSPEARAKGRAAAAKRSEAKAANLEAQIKAWGDEHPAERDWLAAGTVRAAQQRAEGKPVFEFPVSMLEALGKWGSLTDGQLAAVRKLIARDEVRVAERAAQKAQVEANAPTVDVSKIEQAFATARAKADRPNAQGVFVKPLRLQAGDVTLQFRSGSEGSQWQGQLFVKTGDKKLGSVKDGKFVRRFECTDAEEAAVLQACADPLQAALAFGKAWSCCAVCGRTLLNDGSIERGIGPICAGKFGWA
jgi:hypothetical protein